ncbi:amidohydrolase [Exiguobacterium algae]|uniref:amidohydrolase n=1 Tax=Exiguobacterium algae TaxID=2751250 RepID=UPI001BE86DB9|nr:amidohydrolase [Exiguobacterium algae]
MGTLWVNGKIYTLNKEHEMTRAMYVEHGRILKMGEEGHLRRTYAGRIENIVNLEGKSVYPAFTDSHIHLIGYGEALDRVDASESTNLRTLLESMKEKDSGDDWLVAEGFDDRMLGEMPTREMIDEVIADRPVVLKRVCRHVAVVNSKGLERLGLIHHTVIEGGKLGRDAEGKLNGVLYDAALDLLYKEMSGNRQKNAASLRRAIDSLFAHGIVGAHTEDLFYHGDPIETIQAYEDVLDELPFHAHLLVHEQVVDRVIQHDAMTKHRRFDFGAMKLFVDGSFGGRTALLSAPYADDRGQRGIEVHRPDHLEALVKKARSYGMNVAAHVIGDAAVEQFVSLLEKYPAKKGTRDRIIHASLLNDSLLKRIRALPVLIDAQPVFLADDMDMLFERLGNERIDQVYRFKSLMETGALFLGGSDAPISSVDVRKGLFGAVTRQSFKGSSTLNPSERLSMYEALRSFTYAPHVATGTHGRNGLLIQSYNASFTVWEEDFFDLKGEEILQNRLVMTVVDGNPVYEAEVITS